jgi:pyruvate kinase
MSKVRPNVPIMALSPETRTLSLVNLYWGVKPMLIPPAKSLEEMVNRMDTALTERVHIKEGQQIVLISGFPVGSYHLPNLALLHTIGEEM